jgi:4-diphosphocytidyl-2C-methyl-D-erythritol kinase
MSDQNDVKPSKKQQDSEIRTKVMGLLAQNVKPGDIAKQLGIATKRVYNIKTNYYNKSNSPQSINNIHDISNYEESVINSLKAVTMEISNTLLNKSYKNESSVQLMKSLGIAIDKLRLIEGKSTENIAQKVIAQLDPQQLKIIEEMGKSLIESMLK